MVPKLSVKLSLVWVIVSQFCSVAGLSFNKLSTEPFNGHPNGELFVIFEIPPDATTLQQSTAISQQMGEVSQQLTVVPHRMQPLQRENPPVLSKTFLPLSLSLFSRGRKINHDLLSSELKDSAPHTAAMDDTNAVSSKKASHDPALDDYRNSRKRQGQINSRESFIRQIQKGRKRRFKHNRTKMSGSSFRAMLGVSKPGPDTLQSVSDKIPKAVYPLFDRSSIHNVRFKRQLTPLPDFFTRPNSQQFIVWVIRQLAAHLAAQRFDDDNQTLPESNPRPTPLVRPTRRPAATPQSYQVVQQVTTPYLSPTPGPTRFPRPTRMHHFTTPPTSVPHRMTSTLQRMSMTATLQRITIAAAPQQMAVTAAPQRMIAAPPGMTITATPRRMTMTAAPHQMTPTLPQSVPTRLLRILAAFRTLYDHTQPGRSLNQEQLQYLLAHMSVAQQREILKLLSTYVTTTITTATTKEVQVADYCCVIG